MSGPGLFARARKPFRKPADTKGQRLIGLVSGTDQPIWAPPGHSLLMSANGGGKTTCGAVPWILSLIASPDRPAILITDSKDGELAAQLAPMLDRLGIPIAIIDDMRVLPAAFPSRAALNPVSAVIDSFTQAPEDLIFANEIITNALISEPAENDDRNLYFRAWPRALIEFAFLVLLKRNPKLATPGGAWALLYDAEMMARFAEIEAEEDEGMTQALARNILGMVGHEHWPQHLEAAQRALRIYTKGSRLHDCGVGATTTHFDLIRKRAVIFLVGPQAQISRLGSYYAMHLMGFTTALYRGAGPLTIINDEFTNAPLKPFVDALTTIRAYGGEAHNIAQSRSEIEKKFGRLGVETIEENAIVKQWFGFSSFAEAKRLSEAIGEEHAIQSSLGADSDTQRLQTNLSLIKQRQMSASDLMAMPPHRALTHVKGLGFFVHDKIGQQNIAPYCHLIAPNPLEGGRLKPDPKITLAIGGAS